MDEEEKAKWSTIKQWTLLRGYAAYREQVAVPPGTMVILSHHQSSSEHPLVDAAPALQRLLLEGSADRPMPPLILVLDLSGLAPTDTEMKKMLDMECSRMATKKPKNRHEAEAEKSALSVICKATARALEKLHLQDATFVASTAGCQLLLKLLLTSERGASAGDGWKRVVLLHPSLPASTVNGILAHAPAASPAKSLPVDVVFESEAAQAKRIDILRASFPLGTTTVLPGSTALAKPAAALALVAPALLGERSAGESDEMPFDPAHMDAVGRTIWMGQCV